MTKGAESFGGSRLIGRGLRFECRGCGACCRGSGGHVFLTEDEGRAIAAHLGLAAEAFFAGMTRKAEGRTALIDAPGGDCRFLTPAGCAIYPARPRQCRSWPFWFKNLRSDEAWELTGKACPGIGAGRLHTAGEILAWLDGDHRLKGKR